MKWIKYSRYTGEDFGVDADDLLKALSDFLLQSGFNSQYMPGGEWDEHTLENLKQAIQQALESGKLFNDDALQEMMERLQNLSPEQMDQLLDNLIQKMVNEGQITIEEPGDPSAGSAGSGPRDQGQVRGHRQIARFSGLQDAEGPARLAGPQQLRPPRYARSGHRHRGQRILQELRVRRHVEPGCQRHAVLRHPAGRRKGAAQSGVFGPARSPVRVPELLRHGADAGLQPQHDPVRRGPLHARQEGGAGAGPPDQDPISRRQPALRAVPRRGRGTGHQPARARAGGSVLHEHPRWADSGAAPAQSGAQGHAPDRHDHRRQAELPDAGRRPRFTRTRSAWIRW